MKKSDSPTPMQVALSRQKTATEGGARLFEYTDKGAPLVEEPELVRFLREEKIRQVYIDSVPQNEQFWASLQARIFEMIAFSKLPETVNVKVTNSEVFVDFKSSDGTFIASLASRIYDDGRLGSGYIGSRVAGTDFYSARDAEKPGDHLPSTGNNDREWVRSTKATGGFDLELSRSIQHDVEAQDGNGVGIPDGDLDSVRFLALLDRVKRLVDDDPRLHSLFLKHALKRTSGPADLVADEIAAEVTDMWDRRKVDHPREPWIKNPSLFVAHVYKKWLEAGTLKQLHLKHDPILYQRYAKHISVRPDDDLSLLRSPAGRPPQPPRPKMS